MPEAIITSNSEKWEGGLIFTQSDAHTHIILTFLSNLELTDYDGPCVGQGLSLSQPRLVSDTFVLSQVLIAYLGRVRCVMLCDVV